MNKLCKKCDTVKPVEGFGVCKSKKDGLNSQCKECRSAYSKAWQKANPEKCAASAKTYREANREKINASERAYREANPERRAAIEKAWRKANKEKIADKNKAYREANPEKKASQNKAWADANKEKIAVQGKAYRKANPEKLAANVKAWRKANPEKATAAIARRRAAKIQRTPEWLTQEHHDQILSKYAERDRLNKDTGVAHHVDHIVPLQGENISGLHVPWNLQVITAAENQQKSNSY